MKEIMEWKDPDLVERVKVVKEAGTVSGSAMATNAKNTKEYFDTLKQILSSNNNISSDFRQYAEKEMEFYLKAIDKTTTEEQVKVLYEKIKKLHEDVIKIEEKCFEEAKSIKNDAKVEAEENKKFNWKTLTNFGIGTLATIGVLYLGKDSANIVKKIIDK